jgi:hypothetical protein
MLIVGLFSFHTKCMKMQASLNFVILWDYFLWFGKFNELVKGFGKRNIKKYTSTFSSIMTIIIS